MFLVERGVSDQKEVINSSMGIYSRRRTSVALAKKGNGAKSVQCDRSPYDMCILFRNRETRWESDNNIVLHSPLFRF